VPELRARNRSHDHAHDRRAPRARGGGGARRVLATVIVLGLGAAATACGPSGSGTATDAGPTFHRVESDALQYAEPLSTVTDLLPPGEDGEPWRIVGSVLEPATGISTAAVWTSDDGRGWERADIDPADRDVSETVNAVTRVDNTVLAVGRVGGEGSSNAAVWKADGDTWTMSSPTAMGGKHDQWAFDVTAGAGGILVAGGESIWGEIRPRLWFSRDGQSWSSVDGGPGGPVDATGEESIQAVSAFGQGFVAVGWRDIAGEQDGIAWYSPDGLTWERVETPTMWGPGRQNVQSVAVVGSALVAGGFVVDATGQGRPVVWHSTDGRSWSGRSQVLPLSDNGRNAASDMSIRSFWVRPDGSEILASGGDAWRPHVWQSIDKGVSWRRIGDVVHGGQFEDGIDLVDVARSGENVVALGGEPTVLQLENGRWLDATGQDSFPTGGNKPAATSVLADDGKLLTGGYRFKSPGNGARKRYTGAVWMGDGDDLREVQPEGEAEHLLAGKINDLARFEKGYVAVGFEDFSVADQRNAADAKPDGLIWTSADGGKWTRRAAVLPEPDPQLLAILDNDPNATAEAAYGVIASQPMVSKEPVGGPGTRSLEAVAPLGSGFIAVGSAYRDSDNSVTTSGDWDTDPIVVVSGDGNDVRGEATGLGGPGTQRFRDVCVRDDQALAVGVSGQDNSFDVAVRLRGRDGRWHAGEATDGSFTGPDGAGSQEAFGCAVSAAGWVVVGSDGSRGNSDARVWTSTDGLEWEQVTSGALGGAGEQSARAVAAVPDGGWLVGGSDAIGGDSDIALWRVDSGGRVSRRDRDEPSLGGPGTQAVASLSVTGNKAVIVGEYQSGLGMWETSELDR
jgi:hypothetical protein